MVAEEGGARVNLRYGGVRTYMAVQGDCNYVPTTYIFLTIVAKTMPFRTNICFSGVEGWETLSDLLQNGGWGVWRDGETYSIKTSDGRLVKRTG